MNGPMNKTIALNKEIMREACRRIAQLSQAEGEKISFSRYIRRLLIQDIRDGKASVNSTPRHD